MDPSIWSRLFEPAFLDPSIWEVRENLEVGNCIQSFTRVLSISTIAAKNKTCPMNNRTFTGFATIDVNVYERLATETLKGYSKIMKV